ncbi:MAG: threonine synthase [Rhodospirillales bacterium]|nr:threonine synthase [Rhodospirillales bacterium]
MKYVSTRGKAPVLSFDDALLAGLASDGGLYVPETWPRLTRPEMRALSGLSYTEVAARVMSPFVGAAIGEDDFTRMVVDAYRGFDHPAVAPLTQLGRNQWLLELFHGPTLSFKDYALQLVGRLFDHVLARRGERIALICATSGDTGSAAIEACRDRACLDIFVLHPKGRVSDVQRRQMTTVASSNVHNIAVEGTFDDCQDLAKGMFNDRAFRDRFRLSAVNSINWARIMAQVAYYVVAAVALGAPGRRFTFAVPTGNFGNVYAAYAARRMGLPVNGFVIGSNVNDVLTRYFATGEMRVTPVHPTLSPSMDIQVSSNFERLLFDYYGRDGARLGPVMERFRKNGQAAFGKNRWRRMARLFSGFSVDDEATKMAIRVIHRQTGQLLDPHSAIAVTAGIGRHDYKTSTLVSVATAHPAKFPQAVEDATGIRPPLPAHLADLHERPERFETLPNDLGVVQDFVTQRLAGGTAS